MDNTSLDSAFIIQNALLAARFSKIVGNRLSVHGISFTEYLIMSYLNNANNKAVPRIVLAEHMGMSASGITRLLAPMEKNRLVKRIASPRDARLSLVSPSDTGSRVLQESGNSFEYIAADLLANLSKGQLTKATDIFSQLL